MFSEPHFIYQLILIISNAPFIIFMISIGYLNINPQIFKEIQCAVLLAILINIILKEIFHMQPLPDHDGWSFPSGHSHIFSVMCVSLFIFFRTKFILFISIISMMLLPITLVEYKHHFYSDVIAAYAYSIGTLGIFFTSKNLFDKIINTWSIHILSIFLVILNVFVYINFQVISFLSTSITLLIFLYSSNIVYIDKECINSLNIKNRILVNVIAILCLSLIYFSTKTTFLSLFTKQIMNHISYGLCAVLIGYVIPKYLIINQARAGYVKNNI